jgi:hypothetical protein
VAVHHKVLEHIPPCRYPIPPSRTPNPPTSFIKCRMRRACIYSYIPNGGKYFRYNYRFNTKRLTLALGVYPATSLKEARDKRDTAIKQIAGGINPSVTRKIEKAGSIENTFKAVAEDFLMTRLQGDWSASHHKHVKGCFERDVYPWLGNRPLKELSAVEVLTTLRRIVDRGAIETAARTKQFIGQAIGTVSPQDAQKGT